MRTFLSLLCLAVGIMPFPSYAEAPNDYEGQLAYEHEHQNTYHWDQTEKNVFIELSPQINQIKPGETIPIVIEQIIRPHWHTYWKNPGDSGEPMRANWTLPEGFSISEIEWPTPIKVPFEPLVNYGYHGDTLFIQNLTAPQNLPEGPITLPVRFDILVCQDICIPESVSSEITLNGGERKDSGLILNDALMFMPQPQASHGWTGKWHIDGDDMLLTVTTGLDEKYLKQNDFEFFPNTYGLIQNADAPRVSIDGNKIQLRQLKENYPIDRVKDYGGVLVLIQHGSNDRFGYALDLKAPTTEATATHPSTAPPTTTEQTSTSAVVSSESAVTLFQALVFALIGGLILNLMPCVFPVLSMKVLSLSKLSEKDRKQARQYGLAYTAGIILSFLGIAGLLLILKASGSAIGWGFHLQNPVVILLLIYLFFLIALNLSGYFDVGTRLMSLGSNVQSHGLRGSFLTGILATIVATPCTAPFMAAALGYALIQPAFISLLIFTALGLGLALPFLLICYIPALQKLMPRPGNWMVTFKEFLAFPMFGAVIWLIYVLAAPFGLSGMLIPLIGLLGISFSIWLLKHQRPDTPQRNAIYTAIAILIAFMTLVTSIYKTQALEMNKDMPPPTFGQVYSEEALDAALETDQPVFVEMTAAWCVTCKVNHYRAIDIPETRALIDQQNIVYLVGDWTSYEEHITAYLNKFGRNGVPIYVYYGSPDPATGQRPAPELLPQLLTPSIVAHAFTKE